MCFTLFVLSMAIYRVLVRIWMNFPLQSLTQSMHSEFETIKTNDK